MKPAISSPTSKPVATPRLRIGLKPATQPEFAAAVNAKLGKQRVSIMLDTSVLEYFKAKADGRGYQTLINQSLHEAMTAEHLEVVLRKVIREELHA
ncbi:hypothetical protein os1_29820 [Comamonadaceae bacterium OS-1]|nr:hypothetical protein os1_29820 [Comamonadaceae bacterium OS-1]